MEDELLHEMQKQISKRLLPAIVPVTVLVTIGIVGNILTIAFYVRTAKRTVPSMLIKCLAVVDLTTCFITVPAIADMIINVRYSQSFLCKLSHFMGNWTIASSGLILVLINIDRYRKICYPLAKQFTISAIKFIVLGFIVFSSLLSGRLFATFDIIEVNVTVLNENKTLKGYYCAAGCEGTYEYICLVFYAVDFTFIVTGILMAIVMYSRIIYTLVKRKLRITRSETGDKSSRKDTKRIKWREESSSTNDAVSVEEDNALEQNTDGNSVVTKGENINRKVAEVYTIAETEGQKTRIDRKRKGISFAYCSVTKRLEWNLTLMMFATTVVFIVCFIPYFAIRLFIRLLLTTDEEYNYDPEIQFALILPYLNSAFNPIVYSLFNVKFRRYVKRLAFKC